MFACVCVCVLVEFSGHPVRPTDFFAQVTWWNHSFWGSNHLGMSRLCTVNVDAFKVHATDLPTALLVLEQAVAVLPFCLDNPLTFIVTILALQGPFFEIAVSHFAFRAGGEVFWVLFWGGF